MISHYTILYSEFWRHNFLKYELYQLYVLLYTAEWQHTFRSFHASKFSPKLKEQSKKKSIIFKVFIAITAILLIP